MTPSPESPAARTPDREQVFAVPRDLLFGPGRDGPQGFLPAAELGSTLACTGGGQSDGFFAWLERHGRFVDRPAAEADPSLKQPIPYVAVAWRGHILVVERLRAQGERRLHGMLSVGLGGHIEPVDHDPGGAPGSLVLRGMQRELAEELALAPGTAAAGTSFLGVINDDATEVGRVHLGLAFRIDLEGDADPPATIREAHKMTGRFTPLADPAEVWDDLSHFESWSRSMLEGAYLPSGGVMRRSRKGAPLGQFSEDSSHGGT